MGIITTPAKAFVMEKVRWNLVEKIAGLLGAAAALTAVNGARLQRRRPRRWSLPLYRTATCWSLSQMR